MGQEMALRIETVTDSSKEMLKSTVRATVGAMAPATETATLVVFDSALTRNRNR